MVAYRSIHITVMSHLRETTPIIARECIGLDVSTLDGEDARFHLRWPRKIERMRDRAGPHPEVAPGRNAKFGGFPDHHRNINGELTVCQLQIIRAVIPAAPVASAKWSSASGVRRGNGSRCRGRALRVVVANPSGTRGLPPPGPTLRTRKVAILEASQQRSGRAGSGEWAAAARRNLQFSLRVPTRRTIRGLLDSCLRNPRAAQIPSAGGRCPCSEARSRTQDPRLRRPTAA